MASMRPFALLMFLAVLAAVSSAASLSRQVVGMDVAAFDGREVLVIRTNGQVPAPNSYTELPAAAGIAVKLSQVGADNVPQSIAGGGQLISKVTVRSTGFEGITLELALSSPDLGSPGNIRISQPSDHIILVEVFPSPDSKMAASLISNPVEQLNLPETPAGQANQGDSNGGGPVLADQLAIPTFDLSKADPSRVLGFAAEAGLLDTKTTARIITENLGELTVKPAGQSIASWCTETPPGELYLSGSTSEIAEFMALATEASIAAYPDFEDYWQQNRPTSTIRSATLGNGSSTRARLRDDPHAGLYYEATQKRPSLLSNVRVTLPAMNGMNLYEVLNYLSLISGISLIIDPYAFDEPTGYMRDPLPPDPPGGAAGGPGYRPAGVFDPQLGGSSGTVMGNFDNVPFDTALQLILETHGLRFVVYSGDSSTPGKYGAPGSRSNDPYTKPVILVTSPERMEQEIPGQSEIDLYQFHYADPYQVSQLLQNFNLLPSTESGWYIYQGGGFAGGGGSGGGGVFGGSGSGGGRGGGIYNSAKNGLLVYRGSTRSPVLAEVADAIGNGDSVVRVLLRPESSGQKVTAFAR